MKQLQVYYRKSINLRIILLYHHNDHLILMSVITNSSGGIVEETFYDPYGNILDGGETSRFDYEGKEFSYYTDDYDFNFRKYNPEIGVFTQPEQIFPNVYDPQQLNRYRFERNNPYLYVDRDGKALQFPKHLTGNIDSNILLYFNSAVRSAIGTALLHDYRNRIDESSLNLFQDPIKFIEVRGYDVLLKPQIDVNYWILHETDSLFLSYTPSEQEVNKIRQEGKFGIISGG